MQKSRYDILLEVSNATRHKNSVGTPRGFTLIELLLTVAVLAILAGIAIPRMDWDVLGKVDCQTSARKFGNYLKLARSFAITNAADNTSGYKVVVSGPFTSYSIINAGTEEVVKGPIEIPEGVTCTGDGEFAFTTLGELTQGSGTLTLEFSSSGETTVVSVTPIGRITVAR